ncbi:MAG: DNA-directed DNA polymerase [Candidatus Diapherotrites archaeon]
MNEVKGLLLDIDYSANEKEESEIELYVKTEQGVKVFREKKFRPYFYVIAKNALKLKKELDAMELGEEKIRPLKVELAEKENEKNALKLSFRNTKELSIARESVKELSDVIERREYDIPFTKRFLIDNGLEPMNGVRLKEENGEIKEIRALDLGEKSIADLRIGAFDLETFTSAGFTNPAKDEIVMISYADQEESVVWTTKKVNGAGFVKTVESESEMIKALVEKIREKKLDLIVTYNGDLFDFPFIEERAKRLGVKLFFGELGAKPIVKRKGLHNAVRLRGMQHIDAYQLMRLAARFGIVNVLKFDLETVAEALFGKKKSKIHMKEINEIWLTGKGLNELAVYNKEDSEATLKIALRFLPLVVELSKLVKQTPYDIVRGSSGILVEYLLINRAFNSNQLIPNKPMEAEVKARVMQTFKGGYVKEPMPGLHENIAVLDFQSLHPSIMISHNISPETINCAHNACKTGKNVSPSKDWFCEKEKGFISGALEEILNKRIAIKKEMRSLDKKSEEFVSLDAKQHALKIVLNSFYGSLGYSRFRWYSRECAQAVTAWSRHYIRDVLHDAEKKGFTALYSDTDSALLIVPKGKTVDDVKSFVEKINEGLPGVMELEFEGYYKRGIFVTKKEGGAAKKRYALVDFNGNLTIVGFEYVRRDWARIAKETQREVIEAVLKEGKPEKAIAIVREKIEALKKGKVKKEELVILTQVKKGLREYESIGPHIAAALKAEKIGRIVSTGETVGYIVTKSGKSISDKARLEEFVKEGDYDADYYISHQVVPAVSKIMAELGYSAEDLVHGGKQKTLGAFS